MATKAKTDQTLKSTISNSPQKRMLIILDKKDVSWASLEDLRKAYNARLRKREHLTEEEVHTILKDLHALGLILLKETPEGKLVAWIQPTGKLMAHAGESLHAAA